tara:strand:- start:2018 stop:2746 length:729 start_codon:yes stop_codon:yes gene_type:complete
LKKTKKNFVAIIPARAKSAELKNKNIIRIKKHPLISYSIEAAKKSKFIKRVFVTTDGKKIAKISKIYGADIIKRPMALAGNIIMPDASIVHAINHIEKNLNISFDNIVFLQPTSPIRKHSDIDNAIKLFKKKNADSLFSSVDIHPLMWKIKKNKATPLNYNYKKRVRRQDTEKNVVENGSIYITKKNIFKKYKSRLAGKIITYMMDSWSIFEIDNKKDSEIISSLLSQNLIKKNKLIIPKKK